jgi:sensor c-di-GMP phosphodiesterase-like protein
VARLKSLGAFPEVPPQEVPFWDVPAVLVILLFVVAVAVAGVLFEHVVTVNTSWTDLDEYARLVSLQKEIAAETARSVTDRAVSAGGSSSRRRGCSETNRRSSRRLSQGQPSQLR